ncbi:hypothetical protein [Pseudoalteromonas sp. C12FD-1]|jgi:hypothetical protein|uniref:hypothetical protein n=1 Tax=Pseudoalteromonas sp. C12FD-1 TaxID=3131979 RepID=UPI00307EF81D
MKWILKAVTHLFLMFLLTGCVLTGSDDSSNKNYTAFNNRGLAINYTAKEKRIFIDRKQTAISFDTKYQATITDFSDKVTYQEKGFSIDLNKAKLPEDAHKDWESLFVSNTYITQKIFKTDISGKNRMDYNKDISVTITQHPNKIVVIDEDNIKKIFFKASSMPIVAANEWDELYHTQDKKLSMYRSIKKRSYLMYTTNTDDEMTFFNFIPKFEIYRSLTKNVYRFAIVKPTHTEAFDFLPTRNFICADLTKQYASIRQAQGIALAKNIVLGLVQAYTSFSTTTTTGQLNSSYSGVYNDSWGHGTWSGYGTGHYSGFSQTYDYSFIGDRAADLLNLAFSPNAKLNTVETALDQNQCETPWY